MNNLTRKITFNAVIAAAYAVCTIMLAPFSYGVIQLRMAECLAVLPFLFPFSIWGVTIGCVIANLFSPLGIADILLGSSVTLIAAFLTSKIRNRYLALLPPVLLNAFLLPVIWIYFGGETVYWMNVLSIALSQTIVIYTLGLALVFSGKKYLVPLFNNQSVKHSHQNKPQE